ncbi:Hypothetical predicted protein [Marmota monax]|uniref:Uncharacterized protein n=1 Tax=Marmota monax TaxID=9995 RepID=A0A5E4CRP1_MARMO|nr:Hypothetical predicted protein [Marmota monax]
MQHSVWHEVHGGWVDKPRVSAWPKQGGRITPGAVLPLAQPRAPYVAQHPQRQLLTMHFHFCLLNDPGPGGSAPTSPPTADPRPDAALPSPTQRRPLRLQTVRAPPQVERRGQVGGALGERVCAALVMGCSPWAQLPPELPLLPSLISTARGEKEPLAGPSASQGRDATPAATAVLVVGW